jgi:hypothetical protein
MAALALTLHPAQLVKVDLVSTDYQAFRIPEPTIDAGEFVVGTGRSDYVADRKMIDVSVVFESGKKDTAGTDGRPYYLRMEIKGRFKIDTDKFKPEQIQQWAESAAPYVLFPYLREQVYAFSVRCGFMPVLVPIYQLPAPMPPALPSTDLPKSEAIPTSE